MKLTVKGTSAVLDARATPSVMNCIARLEGRRRWMKDGGLAFEASRWNIAIVCSTLPNVELIENAVAPDYAEFDAATDRAPYAAKPDLPHQARGKAKARLERHFAIFSEQGTGKTKMAIDLAGERYATGKVTGVIIVSVKGVHRQWIEDQIPKWCACPFDAAVHPLKQWEPKLAPGTGLKFFAINIDGLKTLAGANMVDRFASAHAGKLMVILDECHKIKDDRSDRWEYANKLGRRAAYRLMLSGTPIAATLVEEWAQFKWLDPDIIGIRYRASFVNEFCILGGYLMKQIIGTKNLHRFQQMVEANSFRATKDEIGILPKAYMPWSFDLAPEQTRMIKEMKRDLVAQIDSGEIVSAANFAVAASKIQQIANGFVVKENAEGKRYAQLLFEPKANPRIKAMLEYIDATPGKIAIWCRFVADIENIRAVLGDEAVYYYGATKEMDRRRAVLDFLNPASAVRFFVSNPQAGGTGLNLQGTCQAALYYSNSDNSIDRWQSEDRIHRIGTNGAVVYTDLIAKGSSDRKIAGNLQKKRDFSKMALGEIRDWLVSDDDALDYLGNMGR